MRTMTVKLDDDFALEVEAFRDQAGYSSTSALVRDALRRFMIENRKRILKENLRQYLHETTALQQAADEVEARTPATAEALQRSET